jgi:hypothetical protein
VFRHNERFVTINKAPETCEMSFIRRLIARERETDAVKGQGVTVSHRGKSCVAWAAIAHVVFRMDLKPGASRRIADSIGVVLRLQAKTDSWRG